MTPADAIVAATTNGPKTLGPFLSPPTGILRVGMDADIITVKGNPLENISILSTPQNVREVWKKGRLVKSDGALVR
jgi:imidazolonepropionase-like amidohydrolase